MLPIPLPTCSLTQSNATPRTPSPQMCGNKRVLWPPTLLARFLPWWVVVLLFLLLTLRLTYAGFSHS